jgi:hypothetical protein
VDLPRRLRRTLRGVLGTERGVGPRSTKGGRPSAKGERPTRKAAWIFEMPEPPVCPPGWRTGPPDFVGVGAQKAGTTWWIRLLEAHPDVYHDPSLRSELHFFDRFFDRWPGPEDIERYHRYFPRPDGGISGEKTPEYLADHWVPRMLHEAAPDARIIVMLRDPLERFLSGRTHTQNHDWPDERRIVGDAFHMGLYSQQLARYLDHYPRERVLVLQYERCVIDAEAQLARTFEFLGLGPQAIAEDELRRLRNATKTEKLELEPQRRELLVDLYARDIEPLTELVPDLDVGLWPNFRHLASVPVAAG